MDGVLAGPAPDVDHIARDQALGGQADDRRLRTADVPGWAPEPICALEAHRGTMHDRSSPGLEGPDVSEPRSLARRGGECPARW